MYPATEINTIANPFNNVADECFPASFVPALEPTIPPMMKNKCNRLQQHVLV